MTELGEFSPGRMAPPAIYGAAAYGLDMMLAMRQHGQNSVSGGLVPAGTPDQNRLAAHYDALGEKQDHARWYEDPAFDELIARGRFEEASCVLELGCGTGRLASRLLNGVLPRDARYVGLDISARMCEIAGRRLARFKDRVEVRCTDAASGLSGLDYAPDRIIATFVFDLMDHDEIQEILTSVMTLLEPGGLFCAASLASGGRGLAFVRQALWHLAHRLLPLSVGGCRPLDLVQCFEPAWDLVHGSRIRVRYLETAIVIARLPEQVPLGTNS